LPRGLVLVRRAAALRDARLLDRLARGRLWIALLAVGLVGVVFLQISLLKLNTGISRGVETAQTLERQNTELKLELSRLGGGERVQDSAAAMNFVVPVTGQPKFLDAAQASATRAAANIARPAPIQQLPLGMIPPAEGGTAGVTSDSASTLGAEAAMAGNAAGAAPLVNGADAVPAGTTTAVNAATPAASPTAARVPGVPGAPGEPAASTHAASPPANAADATAPTNAAPAAHATAPATAAPRAGHQHSAATGGTTAAPGG